MKYLVTSAAIVFAITFSVSNPAQGQEEVLMRRISDPIVDDDFNLTVTARQTAQALNSEGDNDRKLFPMDWPDNPPFPSVNSNGATSASVSDQLPLQIADVPCAGASCQMESNQSFFALDFGVPTVDEITFGHALGGLVFAAADPDPTKISLGGSSVNFSNRITSRLQSMYLNDRDIGDDKMYTLTAEYRVRILEDRIGQRQDCFPEARWLRLDLIPELL
ncbi:MAG: hypothetical protein AAF456_08560 [Planctomycetota bacterium]